MTHFTDKDTLPRASVEEANFKLLLSIGLDMFGSPKFATKSLGEFAGTEMEGEDVAICVN